jgi:hypothetical protein
MGWHDTTYATQDAKAYWLGFDRPTTWAVELSSTQAKRLCA